MTAQPQTGYGKQSTPSIMTAVHSGNPARRTPVSSRRPRKRKCAMCGTMYTPKTLKADTRYCSPSCRQKAYYRRHNPAKKRVKRTPELVAVTCAYCGRGELKAVTARAKFCSDSCRTMAARARRSAAAACLASMMPPDTAPDVVHDLIDAAGMKAITARLAALGWTYSDMQRAFVQQEAQA